MKPIYSLFIMLSFAGQLRAQNDTTELFPYGDMNQWMVRVVDESLVIGGNTKYLYEITPGDTLKNNTPYKNSISPWATSTVMAKVSGVVKASVTVFPEKRDSGYCARLETRMERVKVLGLINISVLATGTIFVGEVMEPVRDTKNPQSKLNNNIPFTKRPKALEFDYKVEPGNRSKRQVSAVSSISRNRIMPKPAYCCNTAGKTKKGICLPNASAQPTNVMTRK